MGFFDSLFGPRVPEVSDPEELRTLLFESALAGDRRRLERLCRKNRAAVATHFPAWQKLPDAVRADPDATQRYVHGMVSVAQVFAERLGDPTLLHLLTGNEQSNPLMRWQSDLERSQELAEALDYRAARDLLTDLLIDVRGLQGSGVDSYLPITLGHLAEYHFQSGSADRAVPLYEEALRLCERGGDADGVIAYHGNLHEVHRYLGQPGPAADHAERLAEALDRAGRSAEATRFRRLAPLVRAGEPLNRVVAETETGECELSDLPDIREGSVRLSFRRNRPTLRPAVVLTTRGEQAGSAGRYEEALEAFRAASDADPFDPHSHYQAGFSLLHLQRYAEAVESYRAAEERAPGWFHCRADRWLAEQLALGNVGHEIFLAHVFLEDGPAPPAEKLLLAERCLERAPRLAPLHLHRGKNLAALDRAGEARSAFRDGLACDPEPDVRTRLLTELSTLTEDQSERIALLEEARDLQGNLVAAAGATLALRSLGRA